MPLMVKPTGQVAWHAAAPAGLTSVAAHTWQVEGEVAPTVLLAVPPTQGAHPPPCAKKPAAHRLLLPTLLPHTALPSVHGRHACGVGEVPITPVPMGHAPVHRSAPAALTSPAGHATHDWSDHAPV